MPGIYLITNKLNSNLYVGKTKSTPKKRFVGHVYDANHGSTSNIAKAIRKYGADAFSIELIEEVSIENLDERERFHIARLSPDYNMTKGGEGGETGMSRSKWINNGIVAYRIREGEDLPIGFAFGILESSKSKMKCKRGPFSKEGCENMRQARLKFRHTDESKARMSEARKEVWRLKKLHP
jgi:group I intron endonuclease